MVCGRRVEEGVMHGGRGGIVGVRVAKLVAGLAC
jgi:hypothetical protein